MAGTVRRSRRTKPKKTSKQRTEAGSGNRTKTVKRGNPLRTKSRPGVRRNPLRTSNRLGKPRD